jgi:hypothetical protein
VRETLDRFNGAAVYTKFDFKDIYYRIRIREEDEWKTAFRIKYDHFEYKMILFSFINVSVTFQTYINKMLIDFININYVTYFDDILINFFHLY